MRVGIFPKNNMALRHCEEPAAFAGRNDGIPGNNRVSKSDILCYNLRVTHSFKNQRPTQRG